MLVFTALTQPDDTQEVATVLAQLCQFRNAKDAPDVLSKWYDLMVNSDSSYNSSLLISKTVHSGEDGWWFDVHHNNDTYHVFIKRQLVSSCFYRTANGSNLNLPPYKLKSDCKKSSISEVITTVFEGKVTSSKASWEWNPECCQWKHTPGTPESVLKHRLYRAASSKASSHGGSTHNTGVSAASKSSHASIPTHVDKLNKVPSEPNTKTAQASSTRSEPTHPHNAIPDGKPPVPEELLDTLDPPTNQDKTGPRPRHRNMSDDVSFQPSKGQASTQDISGPGRRRHQSGDSLKHVSLKQDSQTPTHSSNTGEALPLSHEEQTRQNNMVPSFISPSEQPEQEDPLRDERHSSTGEEEGDDWQQVLPGGRKQKKN